MCLIEKKLSLNRKPLLLILFLSLFVFADLFLGQDTAMISDCTDSAVFCGLLNVHCPLSTAHFPLSTIYRIIIMVCNSIFYIGVASTETNLITTRKWKTLDSANLLSAGSVRMLQMSVFISISVSREYSLHLFKSADSIK